MTLLEALIVVALIGILSTLSVLQLRVWEQKAKRSEASSALLEIYSAQSMYWATYGEYATDYRDLNYPVLDSEVVSDTKVLRSFYSIDMAAPWGDGVGYRVIASGNTDSDEWPDVLVLQDFKVLSPAP